MSAFIAVYWREMRLLRRRLKRQIAAVAVSPLLYMLAFGYALGRNLDVGGRSYLEFLLPGLAAMSSMTQAFGIASEINVARFYSKIFEEVQASPASSLSYVMGEIAAGVTRVLLGVGVIIILGFCFGVELRYSAYFWLAACLNGVVFAALAVALAMLVKSHADQALLSNFVITPMAFLGGTFFPADALPGWAQRLLALLPLTHASQAMRSAAFGLSPNPVSYGILAAAAAVFIVLAVMMVRKARD